METRFKDWKIDGYTAESPDGKYLLWIANGFSFFEDYRPHHPRVALLKGIGFWQKYKIWREFCKERNYRAKDFLLDSQKKIK